MSWAREDPKTRKRKPPERHSRLPSQPIKSCTATESKDDRSFFYLRHSAHGDGGRAIRYPTNEKISRASARTFGFRLNRDRQRGGFWTARPATTRSQECGSRRERRSQFVSPVRQVPASPSGCASDLFRASRDSNHIVKTWCCPFSLAASVAYF